MEDKWIGDKVNGVDLVDYLALIKEFKVLQKEKAEG